MTLKLACADFTFPLLAHDQVLQLIAMLEFKGVDIGLFEERSHLWPSREFDNVSQSARRLKQKVADRGLEVADVFLQMALDFRPYAINHPDVSRRERARAWFLKTLEYAAECECKHVTGLPGAHFEAEPYNDSFARAVEELNWHVDQAKAYRVVFGVEAHIGSIVPRPELAEKLVQHVPGLTLTLDYGHFTRIGLPDTAVEPLVQYASHFHVRGARRGRLQETFAHNSIDFKRVFEVARASEYRGWFGIEYVWTEWEHCNACDNLSETILFRDFFGALANSGTSMK
ncbi:MAG: sugar phosphate isomerase/epimerase [Candidatus Poribacteria bacterium]|nr:sugar phosphate isomerase/epimerase [Candidatus Poribacteria bacterium]